MLRTGFRYLAVVTAAVLLAASPSLAHDQMQMTKEPAKSVQLRQTLRDLWVGHIFWVRNVAYSTRVGDMEAAKVAEQNVVSNARAIADSVSPLYGQKASDKLFTLLAGHYGAIKEYMTAAYAGNMAAKTAATEKIKANATDIATFLSGANPNWPRQTLISLLFAHGGHHMAQIEEFAAKDYVAEAQTWDAMRKHMYMIADALAAGIVKQFPKKF